MAKRARKVPRLKWIGRCFKITIFKCVSTPFLLALHPWMWQNYIIKHTNRNLSKFYECLLLSKQVFTVMVLHWRYWYIHLWSIVDVTPKCFTTQKDCLQCLQSVIYETFSSVMLQGTTYDSFWVDTHMHSSSGNFKIGHPTFNTSVIEPESCVKSSEWNMGTIWNCI